MRLKPLLIIKQFERLSNIFDNAGQVVFGVVVLSPLITGSEKVNWYVIIFGLIAVILCWATSVWLSKKGERQ